MEIALLLALIFVATLAAVGVLRNRVLYRRDVAKISEEVQKLRQEIETLKSRN